MLGRFRGLQGIDHLVESYIALGGVTYILGCLRGRGWGGSVDDDRLIFCRPSGRRIADARAENVVHVNATLPHALLLDLAGGSSVEVAVEPALGGRWQAV